MPVSQPREKTMNKTIKAHTALIVLSLIAGLAVVSVGITQEIGERVRSLGGGEVLDRLNAAPEIERQSVSDGGFGRAYRQQPPLIPHKITGYQISPANNRCMDCHDWPGHVKAKAPKVSETHYVDRLGKRLDKISGTRYFCQQCHVPQADAKPLVENDFLNSTQVK